LAEDDTGNPVLELKLGEPFSPNTPGENALKVLLYQAFHFGASIRDLQIFLEKMYGYSAAEATNLIWQAGVREELEEELDDGIDGPS
jgi:hypothetical protein